MNKKVYAKRMNYDNTDIYYDDIKYGYEDIFIYGNRDYIGLNGDFIKWLYDNIVNYSNYELETYYKNNIASYIIDNLHTQKIYINLKQALKIVATLRDGEYNSYYLHNDRELIASILSIIYKKQYTCYCMRGYSQSEWNYLFTPHDHDINAYIEAVYFGTGTEIMIHDGSDEPKTPDDISGYCIYTHLYNIDDIKELIAKETGVNVEDVVYYDIKDIKTYTIENVVYTEAL